MKSLKHVSLKNVPKGFPIVSFSFFCCATEKMKRQWKNHNSSHWAEKQLWTLLNISGPSPWGWLDHVEFPVAGKPPLQGCTREGLQSHSQRQLITSTPRVNPATCGLYRGWLSLEEKNPQNYYNKCSHILTVDSDNVITFSATSWLRYEHIMC